MDALAKLGHDRSGFRVWKVRAKDASTQVTKTNKLLKAMQWIEDPALEMTGREVQSEIASWAQTGNITMDQTLRDKMIGDSA